MNLSFRRITSSGSFIPEIDGLRFIAIASVVLSHLCGFLSAKDGNRYVDATDYSQLGRVLMHGHLGVLLFFVISGFILGMPFAKHHLAKAPPVGLGQYYLRRLTRLEPPYVLVMTALLFGAVYVARKFTLAAALSHYFASIVYSSNFIHGRGNMPALNAVAWSLEIEVQFYILAPIFARVFSIRNPATRRGLLCGLTLVFLSLGRWMALPFISVLDFAHYFLVGLLLTDIYVSGSTVIPKSRFDAPVALSCLAGIWILDRGGGPSHASGLILPGLQLACIFVLYYCVIVNKALGFLSLGLVTNIGGMCYSIYLVHFPIISIVGERVLRHTFSRYSFLNVPVYALGMLGSVALVSSAFFLLVERPCMEKGWYRKIFRRSEADGHCG